MFNIFKRKFQPQNYFSDIAWKATCFQVDKGKLKNAQGKLEVFTFYSVYISLLTSCYFSSDSDYVDSSLIEDLKRYKEYLKLDEDDFCLGFDSFLKGRGKDYTSEIKLMLANSESLRMGIEPEEGMSISAFVNLFETEVETEIKEARLCRTDLFRTMELFMVVNIAIKRMINPTFNLAFILEGLGEKTLNATEMFLYTGITKIEALPVLPFHEPRCQICGSFNDRDDLKLTGVHDWEYGDLLLPVCPDCRARSDFEKPSC
jgi:hypothetical protein